MRTLVTDSPSFDSSDRASDSDIPFSEDGIVTEAGPLETCRSTSVSLATSACSAGAESIVSPAGTVGS